MVNSMSENLAKLNWTDPVTNVTQEFVLKEGATATIGRAASNDIHIPEQHVSRQHAVIRYRDDFGMFMITDLGSANGTFINDQQITEEFPLSHGDVIRLYVPTLMFVAADNEDEQRAEQDGTLISPILSTGKGTLIITSGPQEGQTIPLLLNRITVGRATSKATWEIGLQDATVSRPHARIECIENAWVVKDLGSVNGTLINGTPVNDKGRALKDGDLISFGSTLVLFRAG